MEGTMIAEKWWSYLVRGIIALVFGVILLSWPAATTWVLVLIFGVFVFIEGIFAVVAAIVAAARKERFFALLAIGLLGIIIGIITFVRPDLTTIAILYLIAIWLIVTGAIQIFAAVEIPKGDAVKWLFAIVGILSILIGILLIVFPESGVAAIILFIGIYSVVVGIAKIIFSFIVLSRQRKAAKEVAA